MAALRRVGLDGLQGQSLQRSVDREHCQLSFRLVRGDDCFLSMSVLKTMKRVRAMRKTASKYHLCGRGSKNPVKLMWRCLFGWKRMPSPYRVVLVPPSGLAGQVSYSLHRLIACSSNVCLEVAGMLKQIRGHQRRL